MFRTEQGVGAVAAMEPSAEKKTCKFCNFEYLPDQGRQHGRAFHCTTCASADRVLRNNLGSKGSNLDSFTADESCKFFRDIHKKKAEASNSRLQWTSLRAMLVTALTQRRISSFKSTLTGKELPLEVWLTKGWPKETVLASQIFWSEKHQCQLYVVDITEKCWSKEYQNVESEVLRHESEAAASKQAKKKQKKANAANQQDSSDGEMALPTQSGAVEEKDNTNPQKAQKKVLQHNASLANRAAKAMGTISQNWTSLANMQEKVAKSGVSVPAGIAESAQQTTEKLRSWSEAARAAVNMHEAAKNLSSEDVQLLTDLPFAAADLKTAVQQAVEICKALRGLLPAKTAKGKAKPKACPKAAAAAAPETAAGEIPPDQADSDRDAEENNVVLKRRRTKSAS